MYKLITIFYLSTIIIQKLLSLEGIYEGTFSSYTTSGNDNGYYVSYIDANKNINLYFMDDFYNEAVKYSGKLDNNNQFSFRTSSGVPLIASLQNDSITVDINTFNPDGYYIRLNQTLSAYNPNSERVEAVVDFLANGSGNIDSRYFENLVADFTPSDSFTLFSGIWKIKKGNITLSSSYGSENKKISGEIIITPSYIYIVGKMTGVPYLIGVRQSVYMDTSNTLLDSYSFNIDKYILSASGTVSDVSPGVDGYADLSIQLKKSFFDTDMDGLSNHLEISSGTSTNKKDSDGDRMSDYDEYEAGTDPLDKRNFPAKVNCNISFARGVTTDADHVYVSVYKVDPNDSDSYIESMGDFSIAIAKNKATGSIALPAGYEYDFIPYAGDIIIDNEGYETHELTGGYKTLNLKKSGNLSFVLDGDSDGDGVTDSIEAKLKSDPYNTDSDGDGLDDYQEYYYYGTKLTSADTDKDGLTDYEESVLQTNPKKADSDGDRMSDYDEYEAGTDPLDKRNFPAKVNCNISFARGVTTDADHVYVSVYKVDPNDSDSYIESMGDFSIAIAKNKATGSIALPAGYEYDFIPYAGDIIIDNEGYETHELTGGYKTLNLKKSGNLSFVLDGDSDGDGVTDSIEAKLKSDPYNTDSDGDGLDDYQEYYYYGTKLTSADTDKDGLTDYEESVLQTNPKKADSDGDRMSDYDEYEAGTDPLDKRNFPAKVNCNISFARGVTTDADHVYVSVYKVDPNDSDSYIESMGDFSIAIAKNKATGSIALPAGYEYDFIPYAGDIIIDNEGYETHELTGGYKTLNLKKSGNLSFVLDGDSDGDGVTDSIEAKLKSDPYNTDSDGDGLDDYEEFSLGTSLILEDTDKDGVSDYMEILLSTDPKDRNDKPVTYIEREVLVLNDPEYGPSLNIYYNAEDTDSGTGEMAYFEEPIAISYIAKLLSSIAGNTIENGRLFIRQDEGSETRKWLVKDALGETTVDVTKILSPIYAGKSNNFGTYILSADNFETQLTDNSQGGYLKSELIALSANKKSIGSINFCASGSHTFVHTDVSYNGEDMIYSLALRDKFMIMGTIEDKSKSDGTIMLEGDIYLGEEKLNIFGQEFSPGNELSF